MTNRHHAEVNECEDAFKKKCQEYDIKVATIGENMRTLHLYNDEL